MDYKAKYVEGLEERLQLHKEIARLGAEIVVLTKQLAEKGVTPALNTRDDSEKTLESASSGECMGFNVPAIPPVEGSDHDSLVESPVIPSFQHGQQTNLIAKSTRGTFWVEKGLPDKEYVPWTNLVAVGHMRRPQKDKFKNAVKQFLITALGEEKTGLLNEVCTKYLIINIEIQRKDLSHS